MLGGGWGHHVVFIGGEDAGDEFAFLDLARDDGAFTGLGGFQGFIAEVETQAAFAGAFIRAVAFEASA